MYLCYLPYICTCMLSSIIFGYTAQMIFIALICHVAESRLDDACFATLDSSLKKNTTFIKKLVDFLHPSWFLVLFIFPLWKVMVFRTPC